MLLSKLNLHEDLANLKISKAPISLLFAGAFFIFKKNSFQNNLPLPINKQYFFCKIFEKIQRIS
ncbi:hypothetical protein AUJ61_03500 [Candidatus Pacearchaeota archaeon CG1_02_30_18]|nr:MAG: hypothetical protein AUJ61_03500 [Candidatus Pacearchaeota archaeon CG1_02_30_18]